MKKITIAYWIFTVLFAAAILFASIPDVISSPDAVKIFEHMQLPMYLLPFLGIAKILGIIVVLIPGFPRLKEWAYAGLTIDLVGAVYCGLSVGDPLVQWLPLSIWFILLAGSYYFYHKKQKAALANSALA